MKKYRKIISVLLCAVLLASLLPLGVLAEETAKTEYGVWVNGKQFTSLNAGTGIACGGGTAKYDAENSVLTLDNAVIGSMHSYAGIYSSDKLTVVLTDGTENRIDLSGKKSADYSFGIYSARSLTFEGAGSLSVTSGKASADSYAVYVKTGSLKINGGTLTLRSGAAGGSSMAICVLADATGNLTVSGSASVNCKNTASAVTRGIYTGGSLTVRDAAKLVVSASEASGSNSYGIRTFGTFTVSDNAYVKTTAGRSTGFSIGLYVLDGGEGVLVEGGTLIAKSAADVKTAEAIYSKKSFRVTGGDVTATAADTDEPGGVSYAVNAVEAELSGGNIRLNAGSADTACCGLYAYSIAIGGKTELTVNCSDAPSCYSLGCTPDFVSYIPVLTAGKSAPGKRISSPNDGDYVGYEYMHIERKFKSDAKWYALTVFDKEDQLTNSWVTFDMGTVNAAKAFCYQYGSTVAAEYFNGCVYGVEDKVPYKLWCSGFDGKNFVSYREIGKGISYEIGDISFDYSTYKMYAIGNYNLRRALFTIDLEKGSAKRVGFITGAEGELLTLAVDNDGKAYSIDTKGILYSLDLSTGAAKKIGETGLKADHVQSMSFDRDTGELFWARYSSADAKSAVYEVNVRNASVAKVDVAGGRTTELAALFMAPSAYGLVVGGAPVNPLNAADLYGNGKVSFDPDNAVLTLNNTKITGFWRVGSKEAFGIYSVLPNLKIELKGENAIALSGCHADTAYAIASKSGRIVLSGGKLTVVPSDSPNDKGIYAPAGLSLSKTELLLYANADGISVNRSGANIAVSDSKLTVNAQKKGVETLHGNINVKNSTVLVSADMTGNTFNASLYAGNDINIRNSTVGAVSGLNAAVYSGGKVLLESGSLEALSGKQAVSGTVDIPDLTDIAVLVNKKAKTDGRSVWDKKTAFTKYRYLSISPCTHSYKNVCDSTCDLCGHHRDRSHDYAKTLSFNASSHYYQCTKCGGKKSVTAHEWIFADMPDEKTDRYTCFCGAEKTEPHYYMTGDADNSGDITAADSRIALRISVGLDDISIDSKTFEACDIDLDGEVETGEARRILRAAVGLEKLPAR